MVYLECFRKTKPNQETCKKCEIRKTKHNQKTCKKCETVAYNEVVSSSEFVQLQKQDTNIRRTMMFSLSKSNIRSCM